MSRMLRRIAAGTFRAHSTIVMASPAMKTKWSTVVGNWTVTSVPLPALMNPPFAKPMNRMKRPMPTPIARFRASGTAFMIASRRPARTRIVTRTPSITITPIAPAGESPLAVSENATMALMPRPAASANG